MILKYNSRLEDICDIYDREDLPFSSFCQLTNMNPLVAIQNVRDEEDEDIDHKHYRYLFCGIENDRSDPGWKQNLSNNMPIFHLVQKNMIIFMGRNKELKQKMDDFMMHDMGLGQHMMTMKTDSEGNQTLEKYYPKLKALR